MKIQDLAKQNRKLFLLAILLALFTFACVFPTYGTSLPVATLIPMKTFVPTLKPTLKPTLEKLENCQNMSKSDVIGIVLASPNGGLNIRNMPIELGGIILETVPNGTNLEIYENVGNGWSKIRFLQSDGNYICGYINTEYIKIK